MRLIDGRLCLDDDTIYDEEQSKVCPMCGSPYYLKIAPILGTMGEFRRDGTVLAVARNTATGIIQDSRCGGLQQVPLTGSA